MHKKFVALTPKTQKAHDHDLEDHKELPLTAEQEKLQKQMDAMKPDHMVSTQKFLAFHQSHKTEAVGRSAALHVGKQYLEDHKLAEASTLLEEVVQHASTETFDQLYVRMLYVSVLEEQGQWDKALEQVNLAIPLASESFLPEALLVKSRLLFAASKKKEALEALDTLISKHENAPEAQKARALKSIWQ